MLNRHGEAVFSGVLSLIAALSHTVSHRGLAEPEVRGLLPEEKSTGRKKLIPDEKSGRFHNAVTKLGDIVVISSVARWKLEC